MGNSTLDLKKIDDFFDSEARKKFIKKQKAVNRRKEIAWEKWEREFTQNVIEKNKFDEWMKKMKDAHNETYRNKLYSRGIEPYPNLNLSRTFNYAEKYGRTADFRRKLNKYTPNQFTTSLVEYMGYYFHVMHGQGVACKVLKATERGKAKMFIDL